MPNRPAKRSPLADARRDLRLVLRQDLRITMAEVHAVAANATQHDGEFAYVLMSNLGLRADLDKLTGYVEAPGSRVKITRTESGKYATRVYIAVRALVTQP